MDRLSPKQVPGRQRAVRGVPRVEVEELLSEDDDLIPEPYEVGIARWRAALATRYAPSRPARTAVERGE